MLPGDKNREVATGIVRESDRLQDLLKQFDAAIDFGAADLLPVNPDAAIDWEAQLDPLQPPTAAKPVPLLPSASHLTGAELKLEPHTVTEVLEPLLISAEAIAQEQQLTLDVRLTAQLPLVQIDVKALREVLSNLLDNALKYTPATGKVSVITGLERTTDRGSFQGIAIIDTGVGIPQQDQAHLFERHYRGVQAYTNIPGSGLGLAIAHDLIQHMQGEIQVFSPAQDSGLVESQTSPGTAFIVWLPEVCAPGLRDEG
jgi:hypothetical protein